MSRWFQPPGLAAFLAPFLALFPSLLLALALAPVLLPPGDPVGGTARAQGAQQDLQPVEIVTSRGVHAVAVELAASQAAIAHGLKGRKELPEGRGMLFDFGLEMHATMTMKDTLVPLDMIFIRADGRVLKVAENLQPQTDRQIYSGGPVRGVLEVPAGTVRRFGIAAGDRVSHRIFGRR